MTRPTKVVSLVVLALLLAALFHASRADAADKTPRRAERPSRVGTTEILPLDAVRAGMVGVGYTVFEGTRIDTFSVAIVGILKSYRPGASLIMARASNPTLDKTGIIAGMSGSPIYVNGKLIGALSYTWGFLKEPLAGITPIEEMLDILPGPGGRPASVVEDRLGFGAPLDPPAKSAAADPSASGWASNASTGRLPGSPDEMRPIGAPVMLSGFTPEAIRFLDPILRNQGMIAVPGGAPSEGGSCDSLLPGSSVGVQLVKGDWNAAAIGTVTYRDGDKILAFGHPFTSMGWVDLPMTTADILTVMSSAQISNKVGAASRACGTLLADRTSGIAGAMGAVPPMIPMRVEIRGTGGRRHDYRFEVARDRLLTPGLVSGTVVSAISSAIADAGLCTIRYKFDSYWNGKARLTRADAILSTSPVQGVGDEIGQSLLLLLGERFRPSRLDSTVVVVDVADGLDVITLEGIRTSKVMVAPGDVIEIEATFRRNSRETEIRHYGIRVPLSAPEGDLTIRVCDGDETERWERARVPKAYEPETFSDLMRLYAEERRADHLYIQLYAATTGTVRGGREIARAPVSALPVMLPDEKKADEASVKGATLAEQVIDFERVVRGCEQITVTVAPDRRR